MAKKKIEKVEKKPVAPVKPSKPAVPTWIVVNEKELEDLQKAGKVIGYRPKTKEALVKGGIV